MKHRGRSILFATLLSIVVLTVYGKDKVKAPKSNSYYFRMEDRERNRVVRHPKENPIEWITRAEDRQQALKMLAAMDRYVLSQPTTTPEMPIEQAYEAYVMGMRSATEFNQLLIDLTKVEGYTEWNYSSLIREVADMIYGVGALRSRKEDRVIFDGIGSSFVAMGSFGPHVLMLYVVEPSLTQAMRWTPAERLMLAMVLSGKMK